MNEDGTSGDRHAARWPDSSHCRRGALLRSWEEGYRLRHMPDDTVVRDARGRWRVYLFLFAALAIGGALLGWRARRMYLGMRAAEGLQELDGRIEATVIRRPEWFWEHLPGDWSSDISEVSIYDDAVDEALPTLVALPALRRVEVVSHFHDREAIRELDSAVARTRDALPGIRVDAMCELAERLPMRGSHDNSVEPEPGSVAARLRRGVMLELEDAPLRKAVEELARSEGIPIVFAPELVARCQDVLNRPVTLSLQQEIRLATAFKLILYPEHLDYKVTPDHLLVKRCDAD
jgi:hypothetical protein